MESQNTSSRSLETVKNVVTELVYLLVTYIGAAFPSCHTKSEPSGSVRCPARTVRRPSELIPLQAVAGYSRYAVLGAQEWRWLVWIPDSAAIASLILPKGQITGDYVGRRAVKAYKSSSRCQGKISSGLHFALQGTVNLQKHCRNIEIPYNLPGPVQQDKEMCIWP